MQFLIFGLLLAGSIYLYRRFVRDAETLAARNREKERERQSGASGTLVKDPETGEYRVRQETDEA